MRLPLAPHKEQDGWRYVRVPADLVGVDDIPSTAVPLELGEDCGIVLANVWDEVWVGYDDDHPDSRIISSRKAEESVETCEYLRLCLERGWVAERNSAGWVVSAEGADADEGECAWGDTLRQAYHRFDGASKPSSFHIGDKVIFSEPFAVKSGWGHAGVIVGSLDTKNGAYYANYAIERPDGTKWYCDAAHLILLDDIHDIQTIVDLWPVSDR